MAVIRDRPYVNSNFLVDFGDGDARSATAGFAEVIFPEFTIEVTTGPRAGRQNRRAQNQRTRPQAIASC